MKTIKLGDLEKEVLEVLWKRKEATLKEIWKVFNKQKGLAYTTIATVLQRLQKKGFVKKEKGRYVPVYSKKDFTINLFNRFVNSFLSNFGDLAYASFVEGLESLDKRRKKKLLSKLEEIIENER